MRFWALVVAAWLGWGLVAGQGAETPPPAGGYRQAMRDFVALVAATARAARPGFIVIPQNGSQLLTDDGTGAGRPAADYLSVIDGVGQEDLFYGGGRADYQPTPAKDTAALRERLDVAKAAGKTVLIIDYCRQPRYVEDAYARGAAAGYVTFVADRRGLDRLPAYARPTRAAWPGDVETLAAARNFLALLDPGKFKGRKEYLAALAATDYDVLIIDAAYDDAPLTAAEVAGLRRKANGGRRLVIGYFAIGESEDYRDYWRPEWKRRPPGVARPREPGVEGQLQGPLLGPGMAEAAGHGGELAVAPPRRRRVRRGLPRHHRRLRVFRGAVRPGRAGETLTTLGRPMNAGEASGEGSDAGHAVATCGAVTPSHPSPFLPWRCGEEMGQATTRGARRSCFATCV